MLIIRIVFQGSQDRKGMFQNLKHIDIDFKVIRIPHSVTGKALHAN